MIYGTSITIGILLAIAAAAIGTTSKQLIAASEHLKRPLLFHIGATMNVAVGPIVDASAYAFAPQVVVAPFACLDVIFNALTAPYTLSWQNERLTRTHFAGTAFVSAGAVMTSLFANVDNKVYNVYELEDQLFFRPTSVVYIVLELSAIASANFALRRKLLSPAFRGISLGVVAGVLMGNVFFMKGLIGLIQTTAQTGDFSAWRRLTPYLLAACAAAGAVYGHMVMRKGLGEYKGVFMVTIFEGAHISAACLSGCVVMEELAGYPWWQYLLYWFSVSMIISGMVVMNLAANSAQIEGKGKIYHVAQTDLTPQREEPSTVASPERVGAPANLFGRLADDGPGLEDEQHNGEMRSRGGASKKAGHSFGRLEDEKDLDEFDLPFGDPPVRGPSRGPDVELGQVAENGDLPRAPLPRGPSSRSSHGSSSGGGQDSGAAQRRVSNSK